MFLYYINVIPSVALPCSPFLIPYSELALWVRQGAQAWFMTHVKIVF